MKFIIFVLGMMMGAFLGIAIHCVLIIAKDADEKYK